MKLNLKILIYIFSISAIIYIFSVGFISIKSRKMAMEDAMKIAYGSASNYAARLEFLFGTDMEIVKTLADGFENLQRDNAGKWKDQIVQLYVGVFNKNPQFDGIWDSWELNAIDDSWDKPTGRISYNVWKENDHIKYDLFTKSLDGDPERYHMIKMWRNDYMSVPYYWSYNGIDSVLLTDVTSPIIIDNEYVGLVGADINSVRCQELVEKIKPFEGTNAFLVYTEGIVFASTKVNQVMKYIEDLYPESSKENNLLKKIKKGEFCSFFNEDETGRKYYNIYVPVRPSKTSNIWSLGLRIPVDVIMKPVVRNFRISLFIGILSLFILSLFTWIIANNITKPIIRITDTIKQLGKGNIDESDKLDFTTKDEIGDISQSVNQLIDGLNTAVGYANEIGKGNLDINYNLLGDNDKLGNSLLEMRNSLILAKEEREQRKIVDEKQTWVTQGLGKLNEVLRKKVEDFKQYSYDILNEIIEYANINQGGLYLINDNHKNDIYLEQAACIAYNRRKFMQKRMEMDEGLIGRCIFERKIIHMTDIPSDYIEITSGLGGENPKSLIIVPINSNEEMLGALELASFTKIEPHMIEYLEKACKSIGSTISAVKINIRTSQLLEQSQQQTEEMTAQEEEMRQNLEELQATQEQSESREKELRNFKQSLDISASTMELNSEGIIINANVLFITDSGLNESDILNNSFNELISDKSNKIDFQKMFNQFKNVKNNRIVTDVTIGSNKNFRFSFTPILDSYDNIKSVLAIGFKLL